MRQACSRFTARGLSAWGRLGWVAGWMGLLWAAQAGTEPENVRRPADDQELRYWLQNMVWHHRFTTDEIRAATGLEEKAVQEALQRFDISPESKPARTNGAPLLVLPYPGGRHPRIGFLEGAIRPQRETKISIFTPWDETSYVVVDVPEAIWSNLGLTYLAHTHIDTIWTKQKIELARLEWARHEDGTLDMERELPNGIRFGTRIWPGRDGVRMEQWLSNGTEARLSDLRVQNCVMLKGAPDFNEATNANKVLTRPLAACGSAKGDRWIITAWEPCQRTWANAPVPCLHSDPQFPDCAPGETQRVRGWFSFYEGSDVVAELERIRNHPWLTGAERKRK